MRIAWIAAMVLAATTTVHAQRNGAVQGGTTFRFGASETGLQLLNSYTGPGCDFVAAGVTTREMNDPSPPYNPPSDPAPQTDPFDLMIPPLPAGAVLVDVVATWSYLLDGEAPENDSISINGHVIPGVRSGFGEPDLCWKGANGMGVTFVMTAQYSQLMSAVVPGANCTIGGATDKRVGDDFLALGEGITILCIYEQPGMGEKTVDVFSGYHSNTSRPLVDGAQTIMFSSRAASGPVRFFVNALDGQEQDLFGGFDDHFLLNLFVLDGSYPPLGGIDDGWQGKLGVDSTPTTNWLYDHFDHDVSAFLDSGRQTIEFTTDTDGAGDCVGHTIAAVSYEPSCTEKGEVRLTPECLALDQSLEVLLCDSGLDVDPAVIDSYAVTVTSTTDVTGEAVMLQETTVDSGRFVGALPTSTGGGPGELAVLHGDDIDVQYLDAFDGTMMNVTVSDMSVADYIAPSVSLVIVGQVTTNSALVAIGTDEDVTVSLDLATTCGGAATPFATIAPNSANGFLLDDLTPETTYYFEFTATDCAGNSTFDDNGGVCYSFETFGSRDNGQLGIGPAVLTCPDVLTVLLEDAGLDLDPFVSETFDIDVTSTSEMAGEVVTLNEIGTATAIFLGTIGTDVVDSPGVLWTAHGDTVTATYVDANDGQGGMNVVKVANSSVDCLPPLILDVQVTDMSVVDGTATVTIDTDEPVLAAVDYGTECGAPTSSATTATPAASSEVVLTGLEPSTTYFFEVEVADAANNSTTDNNGGDCYVVTMDRLPDYFTEEFTASDNDLEGLSAVYTPVASSTNPDRYDVCVRPRSSFYTDPSGGVVLDLDDNDAELVFLMPGHQVELYGTRTRWIGIGSNGYVTVGQVSDTEHEESAATHFASPRRVSALFDDLDPSAGGTVSYRDLSDRVAITWDQVPHKTEGGSNTLQAELFYNGRIRITWLSVDATGGIAGISEGLGVPANYVETDLSNAGTCEREERMAPPGVAVEGSVD